jgi:hypothetical protein
MVDLFEKYIQIDFLYFYYLKTDKIQIYGFYMPFLELIKTKFNYGFFGHMYGNLGGKRGKVAQLQL